MDVLSPFIPVLCHSDWLFHGESCPRLDVVHPGRAWPSSPSCTWRCSLHYLFLQATPLFPHCVTICMCVCVVGRWLCDHSMLASLLWRCLTVPSVTARHPQGPPLPGLPKAFLLMWIWLLLEGGQAPAHRTLPWVRRILFPDPGSHYCATFRPIMQFFSVRKKLLSLYSAML